MFTKKLVALLLALVAVLSFAACGGDGDTESKPGVDPDDPFTGKWAEPRPDGILYAYTFNGDGTGLMENLDIVNEFTYTYDNKNVYIDLYIDNPPIRRTFAYRFEDGKLYLTRTTEDGSTTETGFVKQ